MRRYKVCTIKATTGDGRTIQTTPEVLLVTTSRFDIPDLIFLAAYVHSHNLESIYWP